MEFAFLDESGDLGAKGSKFLVLGLLSTSEPYAIKKVVREIKRELLAHNKTAKWLSRNGGEIKFRNFPDKDILKRGLRKICQQNFRLYIGVVKKHGENIPQHFKNHILFELLTEKASIDKYRLEKIVADADYFTNETGSREKVWKLVYAKSESGTELTVVPYSEDASLSGSIKEIIKIEHLNSELSDELQALDLLVGATHRFYESEEKDFQYYDIVKPKITRSQITT